MIILTKGNLLDADAEALVNAVNTEGVMGKGIAWQFAKKYPEMLKAYRRACIRGEVQPGIMYIYERREMFGPRYIINFPMKRLWRSPSRIEDIESGLVGLADSIRVLGIRGIAVPASGCGNGGLEWSKVPPLIERKLGVLDAGDGVCYGDCIYYPRRSAS
jgi:O-acetyl-ADP-ribose deacetylase (regulator of RNase III)